MRPAGHFNLDPVKGGRSIVENSGDNSRKAGIVKSLKWNTKFAIEAADDGIPDIITGDENGVPVNAPAWGGIMATTEAAHLLDLWERRIERHA